MTITFIDKIRKEYDNARFFNRAEPWNGVNIVDIEYNDGNTRLKRGFSSINRVSAE